MFHVKHFYLSPVVYPLILYYTITIYLTLKTLTGGIYEG